LKGAKTMTKANLTIIATIIATFVISMIAFQPTAIEASNNVSPTATPSPRNIKKMPRQQIEVENDETHLTRKVTTKIKAKKPMANLGDTATHERRKQPRKRKN
jgi:hypothetical protein